MIQEYQLSNGLKALLDPDVRLDDIPGLHLTNQQIMEYLDKAQSNVDDQYAIEAIVELGPVMNQVTMRAFIDPPVTQQGGEDSLAIDDVPVDIRAFVFGLVLAHNQDRL